MSDIVNWFIDRLPSNDFVDVYFVLSDLVDINLTDAERCETASLDSLAAATLREHDGKNDVPIGKQVI